MRPVALAVGCAILVALPGCDTAATRPQRNGWGFLDRNFERRFDNIVGPVAVDCGHVFDIASQSYTRTAPSRPGPAQQCAMAAYREGRAFKVGFGVHGGDVIDEFATGRDAAGQVYFLMLRYDATLDEENQYTFDVSRCDGLEFPKDEPGRYEQLAEGVGCQDADDLRPKLRLADEG